jgi:hypothetical protein
MRGLGSFAKAFEAAIDKTLGIDGTQADAVLGNFRQRPRARRARAESAWSLAPRA